MRAFTQIQIACLTLMLGPMLVHAAAETASPTPVFILNKTLTEQVPFAGQLTEARANELCKAAKVQLRNSFSLPRKKRLLWLKLNCVNMTTAHGQAIEVINNEYTGESLTLRRYNIVIEAEALSPVADVGRDLILPESTGLYLRMQRLAVEGRPNRRFKIWDIFDEQYFAKRQRLRLSDSGKISFYNLKLPTASQLWIWYDFTTQDPSVYASVRPTVFGGGRFLDRCLYRLGIRP